ncbi:MAG: hypothetical protein Q9168_000121 [Polycauliona sp. 1 TL-2023]
MRSSVLVLLPTTFFTVTTSLAIEKRHITAWPEPIRSFYTAISNRLSSLPPKTIYSLTSPIGCNIASPSMPTIPDLPPVSEGLTLYHVAVGRGTQNYTCDPTDSNAIPVAAGASATLFNTTCMSCIAPLAMAQLPNSALLMPRPKDDEMLFPAQALVSGHHYFTGPAPTFNLHTNAHNYGIQFTSVLAKIAVPEKLIKPGQNVGKDGSKPVPWLKLSSANALSDTAPGVGQQALGSDSSPVQEVYRVNTAGGSPPTTCDGMKKDFEVEYAAEYWFWSR